MLNEKLLTLALSQAASPGLAVPWALLVNVHEHLRAGSGI